MAIASRLKKFLPFYYGWVVVGASGTAVFARMAPNITTLSIFIFPLSQEFGWSRTLISGAVSAGALAALVLSPAIGWAIDRYGVRPVLVVSMLVLGAAMTSLAWATVPLTFYLAFAAARVVFHTPAPIGASTVASRWFIKKRGRAIGVIFLCGAIGGLVFTILTAQMIEHFGIKAAWLSLGIVVLAVSVAPALFLVVERPEDIGLLPDNDQDSPPGSSDSQETTGPSDDSWTVAEALKTRSFWILFFMGTATQFGTAGWVNTTWVPVTFRNLMAYWEAMISRSAGRRSSPGLARKASSLLLCMTLNPSKNERVEKPRTGKASV